MFIPPLAPLIDLRRFLSILLAIVLLLPQFAGAAQRGLSPFSEPAPAVAVEFCCQDDMAKTLADAGGAVAPATESQSSDDTDPLSGDQSFEMDKIFAPPVAQWRMMGVLWDGDYRVAPSPDPIFSFERPPKLRLI